MMLPQAIPAKPSPATLKGSASHRPVLLSLLAEPWPYKGVASPTKWPGTKAISKDVRNKGALKLSLESQNKNQQNTNNDSSIATTI